MYGPVEMNGKWSPRPSVRALRVLYSNVNGDIRHGVHRGRGAKEQCVSVCVCWEFHRLITCVS